MKYLKQWDIVYDGDKDTYNPGDKVSGKVIVDVQNTITISKIKVRFKGKAEVTMFIGDYDSERVNYFNHEKILFKCSDKEPSVDLQPGHYEYPFHFTLPLGLPYSFSCEGDESAVVQYIVRATIYRPGQYTFVYDKPFKVLGILDLNRLLDAKLSVANANSKNLSCVFWRKGNVLASIDLPKKGYTQGEPIPIHAVIRNRSSLRVKKAMVFLVQRVTMTVYGSTSTRVSKICHVQRGPVLSGAMDEWGGDVLVVPEDLPPTSFKSCELIEVQYQLMLVVRPARVCRRLRVFLDILVGTVPLKPQPTTRLTLTESTKKMAQTDSIYDHGTRV